MIEQEPVCMEPIARIPRQPRVRLYAAADRVERIAHEWVARCGQVDADLVGQLESWPRPECPCPALPQPA
jgi:hypothetical protein